jgi:metal-responsive CopG/Arc/MetJ family transcriptional regulator
MSEATLIRRPGRPRKRSPKGRQYRQITVHLDRPLIEATDAQADTEGLDSRSALVRKALRDYLRRAEKRAAREGEG